MRVRRKIWPWILSVAAHAIALHAYRIDLASPVPTIPARLPIVVHAEPPQALAPIRGKRGQSLVSEVQPPELSLLDLGIGGHWRSFSGSGRAKGESEGEGSALGFARRGRLLEAMSQTGLLHHLTQQVEAGLTYPREFQDAGEAGEVRVRVRCERNGVCPLGSNNFETPHRLLKVLVWRLLDRVFQRPLPRPYHPQLPITLRLVFVFDLDRGQSLEQLGFVTNAPKALARRFSGKKLLFERFGTRAGPLGFKEVRGMWMPTLAFDVESLGERAMDWVEGRTHADPLEKWKLDPRY